MAQNWDYAELSKAAKAAGGPEKYVDMLEQASKDAGKMVMLRFMMRRWLSSSDQDFRLKWTHNTPIFYFRHLIPACEGWDFCYHAYDKNVRWRFLVFTKEIR